MSDPSERLNGPVHAFFGLSYANYLTVPRSVLQSMPVEWQERFCALWDELTESRGGYLRSDYTVQIRGEGGRFERDPLAPYRHVPVLPRKPL